MTWPQSERLYHRLPELYRRRDLEYGEPLRTLLAVVESQLELLEDDIAGLYENWFLETCGDWAVPYLADLLGIRALGQPPHAGAHPKAQVGRVLDYRRRKGTLAVLERVTRDVTGWFTRIVELFEFLAHTQNVWHVRPDRGGLFDVRHLEAVARLQELFAPPELFRTVEVRRIASGRGRFNVPNLALYVWRLQAFSILDSPAVPAGAVPGGFLFDPLGRDLPLFNNPETPDTSEEIVRRFEERHLPSPLRPEAAATSLQDYYGFRADGSARAFEIRVEGTPVPLERIVISDLSSWAAPFPTPGPAQVAVDPRYGRILFGAPSSGKVRGTYAYGFAAEMGGGPYDRRATLTDPASAGFYWEVSRTKSSTPLADAVAAWAAGSSALGVIRVLDPIGSPPDPDDPRRASEIYDDNIITITLAPGRTLVLEAADGARPVLHPGTFRVTGAGPDSGLTINGFLIDAGLEIEGSLNLQVTHTTLVPRAGRSSLVHTGGDPANLAVQVTFSIVGALRLPENVASLRLEDSILDAAAFGASPTEPGPPLQLERVTVLGDTWFRELTHASAALFSGPVRVERRQVGCVRYSYFPDGSEPPRRFRCQPDLALALAIGQALDERARELGLTSAADLSETDRNAITSRERTRVLARLAPRFTSTRFGDPGYAQLAAGTAPEILTGAEDGSEIGAFSRLQEPLRRTQLATLIEEYLRFGLDAGIFYVN
ncbi:MAG TPA: hypothetical protein VF173_13260 [Thermoanaerobaculia bacterium]|nr:hypothetical protein [Thermoanaerobaculia bacterium]